MACRVFAILSFAIARPPSLGAQELLPNASAPRLALRYEISASAVASALATEGLTIAPDHLRLAMPLSTANPTPQLHIAGAELQHDGSLLLRIICRSAGDCMPFFATIASSDRDSTLAVLSGAQALPVPNTSSIAPVRTTNALTRLPASSQSVKVGTHVTLQLTDTQMRIQLPAVAIDTGTPGAEIRVASLDRKHTWRGVVIDADTVRGGVQ